MNNLKVLLLSLLIPIFLNTAIAQPPQLIVNEIKGVMSQGEQIGQEIIIPEVEVKQVESAISKWAKGYKAKLVSPKKGLMEYMIDNATLPTVSDNTVDIYATVQPQTGGGVIFRTFVDLGGTFLTSADHPQAFAAFERELIDFARQQMITLADKNVKNEEKHLAQLESELKALQKAKAGYEKDIRYHTDNIAKREQEIIRNEADQKVKEQQITIQQGIVQEVRLKNSSMGTMDPATKKILDNQLKTEEKNLKTYEKQLKTLRSNLSAAVKDIEKSKATIAQREQDIIKNEQDQQTKQQQIELQKKILEMVRQKRAEIR